MTHPRFAPGQRGGGSGRETWWARAWARAVDESSYALEDLRAGRKLARAGAVGQITIGAGSAVAAVRTGDDAWTVTCRVPELGTDGAETLVELVEAEAGRIGALLSGDLPHTFVEAVEEAGVELLPFGGELGSECTCDAWMDPCRHALAVLTQIGWLVRGDPLVLFALRGVPREELLARVHARQVGRDEAVGPGRTAEVDEDLAVAEEAALRAAGWLVELEGPPVTGDSPPGGG